MKTTKTNRKIEILEKLTALFASQGDTSVGVRELAKSIGIAASVLYYYFPDRHELLKQMYLHNNRVLGQLRAQLPQQNKATKQLAQLIEFQLDHAQRVVAVLKYYFTFRSEFAQLPDRTLPPKATLHIDEVLEFGISTGEFNHNCAQFNKVIAHIINGFLLEYYPNLPEDKERKQLIELIVKFVVKAIHKED